MAARSMASASATSGDAGRPVDGAASVSRAPAEHAVQSADGSGAGEL